MIRKQKVHTYIEQLYCDSCNTLMEQEPYVLTSDPPQYVYKCPKCGAQITTTQSYPRTVYETED